MGVKGLTAFIESKASRLYQDFELSDTYLVIDGNNLFHNLFKKIKFKYVIYGGDYDIFAQLFGKFMDDLLDCGIEPLVLFDGGIEDKKIKTVIERNNQKIKRVYDLQLNGQFNDKPLLPFIFSVFKDVLKERDIKYARTIFEADNAIASVARLLNCPLLSLDSDFYLFDVMYIPFNGLEMSVRRLDGKRVKKCKIFRISNLCKEYPGLQETAIPLIAVLLGNDFLKRNSVFQNFFNTLKLSMSDLTIPRNFQIIQAVILFLQKNSLRVAITKILNKIELDKRLEVLKIIEVMINYYFQCSSRGLQILGFSEEKIYNLVKSLQYAPYVKEKFEFVSFDLGAINLPEEPLRYDEYHLNAFYDLSPMEFTVKQSELEVVHLLPSWFLEEYSQGDIPGYFMDLLTRRFYITSVFLEDCFEKPYFEASLKIVKTIYELLSKGTTDKQSFRCFARKKERPFGQEYNVIIQSRDFPTLSKLRQISVEDAKKILHKALGFESSYFAEIPCEWKLYIISMFYWIENCYNVVDEMYINPLILCLIFNTVNKKMSDCTFKKFSTITFRECIPLANYFKNKLTHNKSDAFRVSIIHPFLLFQNILHHITGLNCLLGNVYCGPKMSELFNGTFIYNVFEDSKRFDNSEDFLDCIFGYNSPNLRSIFFSVKNALRPAMKKSRTNLYEEGILDTAQWMSLVKDIFNYE